MISGGIKSPIVRSRLRRRQNIRVDLLFGAYCHGISGICYFLVFRYLASVDPYEYIGAFDVAEPLEKAGELVHTRVIPSIADVFIWLIDEVFV